MEERSDYLLRSWFSTKKSSLGKKGKPGLMAFKSSDDFIKWYRKQEKYCYICGLTEEEQRILIEKGHLSSARFFIQGKPERGRNRGYWLEVDRKMPDLPYSPENCALCCYFCNNDKSDVFNKEQYSDFTENGKSRVAFLRKLLKTGSKPNPLF